MANETAIAVENLGKSFPGVVALADVSFEVPAGNLHCLLGENGAGKSTFIKILAGAQQQDEGTLRLFGNEVNFTSPAEAMKAGIGVVYQEVSNFPELDVAANLFPNRAGGALLDHKATYRDARAKLDAAGLHSVDERATMGDLSLGQQQMVEIARLIGEDVRVVILDEPTSALTEADAEILFGLIDLMKSRGITIIYISHRLDEVLALSDTITVLKDGRHVRTFVKEPGTTKEELVRYMVGRDVEFDFRDEVEISEELLLEVEDLYSDNVRGVSFQLRKGEVLGIAGLEGSGRTELLEAIFGVRHVTSGTIRKEGRAVRIKNPMVAKRERLGYITKDRKHLGLFLGLDVADNIIAASPKRGQVGGLINSKAVLDRARHYIQALRIKCSSPRQLTLNLSGGNQQKVLLSMWLSTDPQIILIDEPTRGVDVSAKAEIHHLLHRYAAEGKAVVFVSSELTEILASCDRVLVMHEGVLAGTLPNEGLTEETIMGLAAGA